MSSGDAPSLEMMLQSEYKLREELILAFAALIWVDGQVTHVEHKVFTKYINQTGLPQTFIHELRKRVRQPVGMDRLKLSLSSPVLKHYLVEQLILLSLINNQEAWQEEQLIEQIAKRLGLDDEEIESLFLSTADFFERYTHRFSFLKDNPASRQFQDYMNDKLMVQVKKHLDNIMQEIKETRELYDLLMKAKESSLSVEERRKVREQLMDIAKSIPALAIFALPGGGILLPVLIKVLPFNILPSAFAEETPSS